MVPTSKEVRYNINDAFLLRLRKFNLQLDMEQCICVYCSKIITSPLLFRLCEHGSCRPCFMEFNFKRPVNDTMCPKCSTKITSSADVIACGVLQRLIDKLSIKCDQGGYSLSSFIFLRGEISFEAIQNSRPRKEYAQLSFAKQTKQSEPKSRQSPKN